MIQDSFESSVSITTSFMDIIKGDIHNDYFNATVSDVQRGADQYFQNGGNLNGCRNYKIDVTIQNKLRANISLQNIIDLFAGNLDDRLKKLLQPFTIDINAIQFTYSVNFLACCSCSGRRSIFKEPIGTVSDPLKIRGVDFSFSGSGEKGAPESATCGPIYPGGPLVPTK